MPIGTVFIADYGQPSESVTVAIGVPPGVGDNVGEFINVLESVTVELSTGVNISVADAVPATEDVLVVVNPLTVSVVDTDTPTEDVVLDIQNLELAVVDTVVPAEAVAVVVNPLTVDVADAPAAAEQVQVVIPLGIAVVDDNTFPPLEPPPMPATGIARDYVDVEEGLAMGLGLPVLVADDVPSTEVVAIGLVIPARAIDVIPVVDVIDADAVTINPVLIGFDQVVSDTLAPVDVVLVVRVLVVDVSDAVTPADAVAAALPMLAVVADDLAPADVPTLESQLRMSVFDERPVDEDVAALVSVLLASVSDESPGEDLVLAGIPMAVAVMDVPEEGAVGERRHVSIPKFYEDLHFINDAVLEAITASGAALRSGQVQDAELGLSSRVRDAGLKTGQGVDEVLEG